MAVSYCELYVPLMEARAACRARVEDGPRGDVSGIVPSVTRGEVGVDIEQIRPMSGIV